MKSQTIRKYPGYFICLIISISYDEPALVLVDRVAQRAVGGELLQARQPLREPLADDVLEVVVEREARRHVEVRQVVLALGSLTSHRSAMRTVLASASGKSLKTAAISSASSGRTAAPRSAAASDR